MDFKDKIIQEQRRRIEELETELAETNRRNKYFDTVIDKAIVKNGTVIQSIVAMEELSELQKELSKALRGIFVTGDFDTAGILEETADVRIMLLQIMKMYNLTEEAIQAVMHTKIMRLDGRL